MEPSVVNFTSGIAVSAQFMSEGENASTEQFGKSLETDIPFRSKVWFEFLSKRYLYIFRAKKQY